MRGSERRKNDPSTLGCVKGTPTCSYRDPRLTCSLFVRLWGVGVVGEHFTLVERTLTHPPSVTVPLPDVQWRALSRDEPYVCETGVGRNDL